jgi:FixJ family two-component response regulator
MATYASAEQLLDRFPDESKPGCILVDVRLPGMSGRDLQFRLDELGSTLPIIFLTGCPDIRTTMQAIKAGAEDFLIKPTSSDDLFRAIDGAFARYEVTRAKKGKLDADRARLAALTPRERQVFGLVTRGKLNKQIGYVLGCKERTIKAHRSRVMEKMQVQSLAELVALAGRLGIHRTDGLVTRLTATGSFVISEE